jgi:hypothetical protein
MKKQILFLFVLCILAFLSSCGENQITPTNGKVFTIEYDHQISYNVLFGIDKSAIEQAFEQANTELDFEYDDEDLPNYWVRLDSLYEYYIEHVKRDSLGTVMYPGYLCCIQRVRNSWGNPLDQFWGFTYHLPTPRVGHSFVVLGNPTIPFECRAKVTIHELGHQRCIVTHLCLNDTTINPEHNDSTCVMGKGKIPTCTDKDLCNDPHFCQACRNAIGSVSW